MKTLLDRLYAAANGQKEKVNRRLISSVRGSDAIAGIRPAVHPPSNLSTTMKDTKIQFDGQGLLKIAGKEVKEVDIHLELSAENGLIIRIGEDKKLLASDVDVVKIFES